MSWIFQRGFGRAIRFALVAASFVFATDVLAQVPALDADSDSVGATFGEFRVDETGNANYSIPIFAPPGTAGVAPKIALNYNSGGGNGWVGKGWSLSGFSAITRCRKTREAGDFFSGQTPVDGNSKPVTYSNQDVFCLDGSRLLLVAGTYGASGAEYRLELDPYTKVVSNAGNNTATSSYTGPEYFVVQRKDGSTSYYGNSAESRVPAVTCTQQAAPVCNASIVLAAWPMNRFEDSTGNYIDYAYAIPTSSYVSKGTEYLPLSVKWTGKRQLTGQSTTSSSPYAEIRFHSIYRVAPAGQDVSYGWQGGVGFSQSHELTGIEVKDRIDTAPRTLRFYKPAYSETSSGSGMRLLRSVKECVSDPIAVPGATCYRPTTFTWTDDAGASYQFGTAEANSSVGETRGLVSSRIGDVDGDGRADIVWFREAGPLDPTCTNKNFTQVSFADRQEVTVGSTTTSTLVVKTPAQATICSALNAGSGELDTAWGLMDFDGDGRDDLVIADDNSIIGAQWHVYRSTGRPATSTSSIFDTTTDLINVTISTANDSQEQAQLGDFNGDGMLDFLYPTSSGSGSGGLVIRFLQRKANGTGFEFSGPHDVSLPTLSCGSSCNFSIFNVGVATFGVAPDLNGDGRSDIVLRVTPNTLLNSPGAITSLPAQTFFTEDAIASLRQRQQLGSGPPQFFAFVMDARTSTTQSVTQYGNILYTYTGDTGPTSARQLQFVDFNGDSLPDLLYQQALDSDDFVYAINRGNGFHNSGNVYAFSGEIRDVPNHEHMQVFDLNGDSRAEIVFPASSSIPCAGTSGSQRAFRYRSFDFVVSASGGFGTPGSSSDANSTCIAGNTVIAEDTSQWDYFFADFDGDSAVDFVKLRDDGATPSIYTSRAATSSRFKARDVISQVTNGHGAVTVVSYQPLTNKAIYRRASGSRLDPEPDGSARDPDGTIDSWGRASPVTDILSSQYVVSAIASSAPTRTDAASLSIVAYRYSGSRVQAGGRGMLGFATISTFDAAPIDGGWTATDQFFRQDFPFVGTPLQTNKWKMTGVVTRGSVSLDVCSFDPEALGQDCFYDPADASDAAHPGFGSVSLPGAMVRVSASLWGCKTRSGVEVCEYPSTSPPDYCPDLSETAAAAPTSVIVAPTSYLAVPALTQELTSVGTQEPLFIYAPRTLDVDFDGASGAITRHVCGLFSYTDNFGNATGATISTYSGAALSTLVATKTTTNTYVNNVANWRLGRLTTSFIDDTRGGVTKSRVTDFEYETNAATYLLKSERLQQFISEDQDIRTLYTLDDYGNQIYAFNCSAKKLDGTDMTDTDCRNVSLVQQRPVGSTGPATTVHRYSRNVYVQNGRYLSQTFVPYFSTGAPRNVNEQVSATLADRDEFGNPTTVTSANGMITTSRFGALGRAYYQSDNTGATVTTTYRWCDQLVAANGCPVNTSFRQKTVVAGGATSFIYFDVLGRETLKIAETFNAGVSGKNWMAACKAYDTHGREVFATIPFFLATAHGTAADPAFPTGNQNPCASQSSATNTTYDVLGRIRLVTAPDGSTTSSSFSALTTTVTDSRAQSASQTKNALGEVRNLVQADAATGFLSGATLVVTNEYDEQGNLRFVKRNAGNGLITSEISYDSLGRKTSVADPDRGTTTFQYNAAGEVIRSTNAIGNRIEQDYDALGRVWRRRAGSANAFGVAPDSIFRDGFENAGTGGTTLITDDWQYDTAVKGRGAVDLERRQFSDTPTVAFLRTYSYDTLGRPSQRQTSFGGSTYTESTTYDGFGRPLTQTDASGDLTTTSYTTRGFFSSATYSRSEVGTAGKFYEVLEQDAWGNVVQERRAGTITTAKTFNQLRGWIDTVSTGSGTLQNWDFDFDTNGNLTRRNKGGGALIEDLTYDKLNRLKQVSLSGSATSTITTSITYDKLGNICTRGALSYTYQGADGCNAAGTGGRPHAVSQVGAVSYVSDLLGNQTLANSTTDADDHTMDYDAHEQVVYMTRGNVMTFPSPFDAEFAYGPDLARYLRIDRQNNVVTRTTRYVGNVEIIIAGGITQLKRYLAGGSIVSTCKNASNVAVTCAGASQLVDDKYALSDHLGSTDVIVNDAGAAVEATSFDAWGQRRSSTNWQGTGTPLATTTHGFTGHEHVDAIGLIHMNGRVYDPAIGRFVQSDPMIDAGIQGLNRYSYVLNNPLSLTDPTGHLTWGEWMRVAIGVAVTCATAGAAGGTYNGLALSAGQQAAVIGAGGALVGAASSNTLKGAAWGAVSSLAFFGIGSYFEGAGWAQSNKGVFGTNLNYGGYAAKVLAHGVAGGALQHLQGGRFGSGFAAAGVTQAFSGGIDTIDSANPGVSTERIFAAVMLGGTVSSLTGGKFANGALTAAFSSTYSGLAERASNQAPEGGEAAVVGPTREARRVFGALRAKVQGSTHESERGAADYFAEQFLPFTEKYGVEVGANIEYGDFKISDITLGSSRGVHLPFNQYAGADVHTHPTGSAPGLSGYVQVINGQLRSGYSGDYSGNWQKGTTGYAYRAGDGAAWRFNTRAFAAAVAKAQENGTSTDGRWFTEKLR
jgi:RHS repeat-associated protein